MRHGWLVLFLIMKTPETVKVNGKEWAIYEVTGHFDESEEFGACVYHLLKIVIDETQNPQHKRDTLWHELLHAVEKELDLKISEKQVRQIASMQLAIMRGNPALMEFLLEGES